MTSDVNFQEHDEDGRPYDKITRMKSLEIDSTARDLSDFLYLNGTMHRDPEDGLLYDTKILKTDSDNNIIGWQETWKDSP